MEAAIDIGERNPRSGFDVRWRHGCAQLMEAVEGRLTNRRSWICTLLLLGLLQSVLVLIHRPWLDEWQALLIAVQTPDWSQLLANLRYEGHPPLWYAILRAGGAVLPPIMVLGTVQLVISLGTQAAVLSWAVFTRAERLLIGLSYFVLVEFGTVSRSLSLGALLTILFFRISSPWLRWLIVVLLPAIDFQFGLVSLVAIPLLVREGKWSHVGAVAWLMTSLLAAWTVQPAADMIPALDTKSAHIELLRGINALAAMLVPIHYMQDQWHWAGTLPPEAGIPLGLLFLTFLYRQLQNDRITTALLFAFVCINFLFTAVAYPLAVRHWTLVPILFTTLMAWQRSNGAAGPVRESFHIWLWIVALCGLFGVALSVTRPFDAGHEAAAFIRSQGLQDKHWVVWPEINGPVPAALIGQDMQSLGKECRQSFIRWNFRSPIKTRKQFERALRKVSDKYGRIYLITDQDVSRVVTRGYVRKLAAFNPGYNGQAYQLFVVAPNAPEKNMRAPPCVPGLRSLSDILSQTLPSPQHP